MADESLELGLTCLKKRASTLVSRCEMLEKTAWAKEFAYKEIEVLANYCSVYAADNGGTIFNEGAYEAYMCTLITGSVNVVKMDTERVRKVLTVIPAGRTFGEMSLVDGQPRSATIVAAADSTLMVMTKASFERLASINPRFALQLLTKIATMMSQRLRQTSGVLIEHLERPGAKAPAPAPPPAAAPAPKTD